MKIDKIHIVRALQIAFFIGTVLNIINQGDVIFAGDWASLNLLKVTLTYLVPFFVSFYTAFSIQCAECT